MDRTGKCCICGKELNGYGNNPEPVEPYEAGLCCDECNAEKVIPARRKFIHDVEAELKKHFERKSS